MTAFALALALVATPARYSPAVAARCAELRPVVTVAAWAYRVDPDLALGVLAWESGCRHVTGGASSGHYGAGQVRWAIWSRTLRREGIADSPEALLGLPGVVAAVRVLAAHLRDRRGICGYAGATGRRCDDYRRGVDGMRLALGGVR